MSTQGRYKWVSDGERLVAARLDEADDVNTTHADIAEELLGRPGLDGIETGWIWVLSDVVEYETFNCSLDEDRLEALVSAWAVELLGTAPSVVRAHDPH